MSTSSSSLIQVFNQLSVTELNTLLANVSWHERIIREIGDVSNFINLAIFLPENKFTIIMRILHDKIMASFLDSTRNVTLFLIQLPAAKYSSFLTAMIYQGKSQIRADGYTYILQSLSREQRTAVFEFFKDKLEDIIKSPYDFINFLRAITPEQACYVFENFKHKFFRLIDSERDLVTLLRPLSLAYRTVAFDCLRFDLRRVIKTPCELIHFLYCFTEFSVNVLDYLKDDLIHLIKSGNDFNTIFNFYSSDRRWSLLEQFEPRLAAMYESADDLLTLLFKLTDEQFVFVLKSVNSNLRNIFTSCLDFNYIAEYLTDGQCKLLYNHMLNNTPDLLINCISPPEETKIAKLR